MTQYIPNTQGTSTAMFRRFRHVIPFLLGIGLGILLAARSPLLDRRQSQNDLGLERRCRAVVRAIEEASPTTPVSSLEPIESRNLLFVGVMTTAKFLSTRAVAVNRTWAKTIPGRVEFFSSQFTDVPAEWNLPVVRLDGVDDSYPPQKKSFMMLKYMHDNFIDRYEWFMRADDDVYVKGRKLGTFLRSINATGRHFIGQPGIGEGEEEGMLHLQKGRNFCMGGPGVFISRATLKSIVPHISYCLKNLRSIHEDVEVGRCVHQFAGVDCTWSYEMKDLFYHDFSNGSAFTGNLHTPEIWKAIAMHPVKQTPHMYRLHAYVESQLMANKRLCTMSFYREVRDMAVLLQEVGPETYDNQTQHLGLHPSLMKFKAESAQDVRLWDFFSLSRYSLGDPKSAIPRPMMASIAEAVAQGKQIINSDAQKKGRTIVVKETKCGYSRLTPPHGIDYILDVLLKYQMHEGSSRSVRRNTHLHQSFGTIELIEDEQMLHGREKRIDRNLTPPDPATYGVGTYSESHQQPQDTINFIVPIVGRLGPFTRFMDNFERNFLAPGENVGLLVVLYRTSFIDDPSDVIGGAVTQVKSRYQDYDIRLLHGVGDFQRALALDLGASHLPNSALLFLVDVDMHMSAGFLSRCRTNTRLQSQVYFPIGFFRYNPNFVKEPRINPLKIDKEQGNFLGYSYGMVCIYNGDLRRVGGLDTSIVGWGYEDVDLYDKVVSSNLTVFRAPDPGLSHIYHPFVCSQTQGPARYNMCLGAKSYIYGSSLQLMKELQEVRENRATISKN